MLTVCGIDPDKKLKMFLSEEESTMTNLECYLQMNTDSDDNGGKALRWIIDMYDRKNKLKHFGEI